MSIWGYYVCFSVIMSKVYVSSKRECPSDVVLRRSESGALYYLPEERGKGAEVGGVMETFDELFGDLSKDDPLDDVIQFVADNIIPESLVTEEFKSKVRDRIRHNLIATGEVESSMIKGLVFKTGLAEKNRLSRVYVGDRDEVPEGYIPMEDEDGGVYYERIDSQFIDSGRTSKSRVYVDSPEDVPEQYSAQTSDRGAVYYETESTSPYEEAQNATNLPEWEESEPGSGIRSDIMSDTIEDVMSPREMVNIMGAEDLSVDEVMEPVIDEFFGDVPEEDRENIEEYVEGRVESELDRLTDYDMEQIGLKQYKSRIYVSTPNEVPDGYTPQQGPGGGVYYDTNEGPGSIAGGFNDSINEMVEDLVSLVTGDQTPHIDDPTREDLEAAAENLRARQGELMMSDDFVSTLDQLLKGSSVTPEEFFEEIGSLGKRTYISDPSQAPEGVNVQEGSRGGYYYERDPGTGSDSTEGSVDPNDLWNAPVVVHEEMTDDELKEYEEFLWDVHSEARNTGDDDMMREAMSELREVDAEQVSRKPEVDLSDIGSHGTPHGMTDVRPGAK